MENYKSLLCKTKANDVDEKGVVTVAVNASVLRILKKISQCLVLSIKH